jgi:hypothetical protein
VFGEVAPGNLFDLADQFGSDPFARSPGCCGIRHPPSLELFEINDNKREQCS